MMIKGFVNICQILISKSNAAHEDTETHQIEIFEKQRIDSFDFTAESMFFYKNSIG